LGKALDVARFVWYVYSVLCVLFIGVILADLLLVWGVGFSDGVTLYVNKLGEGFQEQIELLSTVPWIVVTFFRTVEDAVRPGMMRVRMTSEEWASFKKWLVEMRGRKAVKLEKPEVEAKVSQRRPAP
jgi:hypothetical protein